MSTGLLSLGASPGDAAIEAGNRALDAAIDPGEPDRVMSIVMTLRRLGNIFTSPPPSLIDLDQRALEWLGPEPSVARGVVAAAR